MVERAQKENDKTRKAIEKSRARGQRAGAVDSRATSGIILKNSTEVTHMLYPYVLIKPKDKKPYIPPNEPPTWMIPRSEKELREHIKTNQGNVALWLSINAPIYGGNMAVIDIDHPAQELLDAIYDLLPEDFKGKLIVQKSGGQHQGYHLIFRYDKPRDVELTNIDFKLPPDAFESPTPEQLFAAMSGTITLKFNGYVLTAPSVVTTQYEYIQYKREPKYDRDIIDMLDLKVVPYKAVLKLVDIAKQYSKYATLDSQDIWLDAMPKSDRLPRITDVYPIDRITPKRFWKRPPRSEDDEKKLQDYLKALRQKAFSKPKPQKPKKSKPSSNRKKSSHQKTSSNSEYRQIATLPLERYAPDYAQPFTEAYRRGPVYDYMYEAAVLLAGMFKKPLVSTYRAFEKALERTGKKHKTKQTDHDFSLFKSEEDDKSHVEIFERGLAYSYVIPRLLRISSLRRSRNIYTQHTLLSGLLYLLYRSITNDVAIIFPKQSEYLSPLALSLAVKFGQAVYTKEKKAWFYRTGKTVLSPVREEKHPSATYYYAKKTKTPVIYDHGEENPKPYDAFMVFYRAFYQDDSKIDAQKYAMGAISMTAILGLWYWGAYVYAKKLDRVWQKLKTRLSFKLIQAMSVVFSAVVLFARSGKAGVLAVKELSKLLGLNELAINSAINIATMLGVIIKTDPYKGKNGVGYRLMPNLNFSVSKALRRIDMLQKVASKRGRISRFHRKHLFEMGLGELFAEVFKRERDGKYIEVEVQELVQKDADFIFPTVVFRKIEPGYGKWQEKRPPPMSVYDAVLKWGFEREVVFKEGKEDG